MVDQDQDQNRIDGMDIEPLSDEALDDVAGGELHDNQIGSSNVCCSCQHCSPE